MGTTYPSPSAISTPNVPNTAGGVTVLSVNSQRAGILVFNPNTTNDLWVCPTGTVPAVNGAGSYKIAALTGTMFGPPNQPAWTNGMLAIASAGVSNAMTILEYYD